MNATLSLTVMLSEPLFVRVIELPKSSPVTVPEMSKATGTTKTSRV